MITGLHHVAISSVDFERSVAFYRDLFGLTLAMEWEFADGRGLNPPPEADRTVPWLDQMTGLQGSTGRQVMLRAPNAHIELFGWSVPAPASRPTDWRVFDHGINHVCFQVADVDLWFERLSAEGLVFDCSPQTFGPVKNVYARDPDGNVIELLEPLASGAGFELPNVPTESDFDLGTRVEGVHHVGISVADMMTTTEFYENNYDLVAHGDGIDFSDGRFDKIWQTTGSEGVAKFFRLGNAFLEVFEFAQPVPKPRPREWKVADHGFTHFSFQIPDVEAAHERLVANDVVFNCPPHNAGRVIATYSHDMEGNLIELFQPLEAAAALSIE